jgi:hypothetical protein
VTELARPEALVQEQGGVAEWVDREGEGWMAPEQVQALEENVCVQNAKRLLLMKSEHPVTL